MIDINDPSLLEIVRGPVTALLTEGRDDHPMAQFCKNAVAGAGLGALELMERDGQRYWFFMLFLRGVAVADLAWGEGNGPGGLRRSVVTAEDSPFEQGIVSPVRPAFFRENVS